MTNRLLVQHEYYFDEKDRLHVVRKQHPKVVDIKHFYLHGDVGTHDGAVWQVKPATHPDYNYVTVGKQ